MSRKHGPKGYMKTYMPSHPRAIQEYVYDHILVAERALGSYLERTNQVHHLDGNPGNNQNANLVICEDQTYHMLLHRRKRVLDAGGDPNIHRLCVRCRLPLPRTCFYRKTRGSDGLGTTCIECRAEEFQEARARLRLLKAERADSGIEARAI